MPRVVAVVQARLGSRRFPRKVLADLCDRPVLQVLLDRLSASDRLDGILIAVPDSLEDDELAEVVTAWGYPVVRGAGDDVLSRYRDAAATSNAGIVVRVTGDCPLIDPRLVDAVIEAMEADPDLDYSCLDDRFPDGADCEAFTRECLERAHAGAVTGSEREHVTLWMRTPGNGIRMHAIVNDRDESGVRLTVDEPTDLIVIRHLVGRLGSGPEIGIRSYAEALQEDLELTRMRPEIARNEGLWRSKNRDQLSGIGVRNGREASDMWLARARRVIPSATQTLSKAPNQFVEGVTPAFLRSGSGCHVTDVDGNVFIDYPMALGPIILGYNHPRTVEAVRRQIAEGTTFTLPHPLEVEVAELVVDAVPCAEMVRFAKNGSDVTDAAVRLARALTGRNTVLACGYHGWHDWYVVQTPRNAGVPEVLREYVEAFPFNDLPHVEEIVDRHAGDVAAIVLEIGFEDPHPGYLEGLKALAHREGALLVFDEIVTGFRFALGGAQEYYGVAPDLACFGKAMANGLPLAAVVGGTAVMEDFDRIFFSGTFGGETLSLAAAKATINEIRHAPVIDHIWSEGRRLHQAITDLIRDSGLDVELIGQPPRGAFVFRQDGEDAPALRGLFLQETVRRGVLFGGPVFVTYAHDPADIDRTVAICAEAFEVMRHAVDTDTVDKCLDGPAPGVVFRLARN